VPFPFSDMTEIKKRPVLVISNSEFNKISQDIVVCQISSNLTNRVHGILIDNNNLEAGNLLSESLIKVHRLIALDKKLIEKRIGKTNSKTFRQVKKELSELLKEDSKKNFFGTAKGIGSFTEEDEMKGHA